MPKFKKPYEYVEDAAVAHLTPRFDAIGGGALEADLLAVVILNAVYPKPVQKLTDADLQEWVTQWNAERRLIRARTQELREQRVAAGYKLLP